MKKSYKLENLDCANCAAKMEAAVQKLEGVLSVSVNFMSQRFTLEVEDAQFEQVLSQAQAVMRKLEPDCRILGIGR